jgi:hypothetical protein
MTATPNGRSAIEPASPAQLDRADARATALRAAATFCAGKCLAGVDVKSADLLKIAEAFERWLEREAPIDQ